MHAICVTCGTQFAESEGSPERCPICADERQYVGWAGQEWTTLEGLCARHRLALKDEGDGLLGIGTEPKFAIGQRALLVPAAARDRPGSNVLWDCISLIDRAAIRVVEAQGGLGAIAISHPHYYASMVEWSRAFDGAPDLPARRRSPVGDAARTRRSYSGRAMRSRSARASRCCAWAATSRARRSCTGRTAPPARACCSRATSCRWCRTAASSASCTAIRTTFRCRPRPCCE